MNLSDRIDMSGIPAHMRDGVAAYLDRGEQPGGFLMAVLENNLVEAAGRADSINLAFLVDWASFLYNQMPERAWGSREKVLAWSQERYDAWRAEMATEKEVTA